MVTRKDVILIKKITHNYVALQAYYDPNYGIKIIIADATEDCDYHTS